MPLPYVFTFDIFAADNFTGLPGGNLPSEQAYLSSLDLGDTITWVGGGTSTSVTVDDVNDTLDEALTEQTLASPVTWDGTPYSVGQIVTPTYTVEFSGSDGLTYRMTSFNFSPNTSGQIADSIFWEIDPATGAHGIPPANTVLTVTGEINPTAANARPYDHFVCFAAATLLATPGGERKVEDLVVGDLLCTQDNGDQAIRWIGHRRFGAAQLRANPKLYPVCISAGALGPRYPREDLFVSRQHRILLTSRIAQRMFGEKEVLVPAVHLLEMPGIYVDESVEEITYFHVMLCEHEIVFAHGAPAESLLAGPQALEMLSEESRRELIAIFPELGSKSFKAAPRAPIAAGRQARKMVERHVKNDKQLIGA